jgi:uncharacterized protein YxeA
VKRVVWIILALVLALVVTPSSFSKTKNSSTNQINKSALTKGKSTRVDNQADKDADWTKASQDHSRRVDQYSSYSSFG